MNDLELKERLFLCTGLKLNDDVMALRWSPLIEHDFWDVLACEVRRIINEQEADIILRRREQSLS